MKKTSHELMPMFEPTLLPLHPEPESMYVDINDINEPTLLPLHQGASVYVDINDN